MIILYLGRLAPMFHRWLRRQRNWGKWRRKIEEKEEESESLPIWSGGGVSTSRSSSLLGKNYSRWDRARSKQMPKEETIAWKFEYDSKVVLGFETTFSFISAKVSKKKECEGSSDPIGDNHHYCVISQHGWSRLCQSHSSLFRSFWSGMWRDWRDHNISTWIFCPNYHGVRRHWFLSPSLCQILFNGFSIIFFLSFSPKSESLDPVAHSLQDISHLASFSSFWAKANNFEIGFRIGNH